MTNELARMLDVSTLPARKNGVRARYEGSIDKTGGNADWNWALYRDANGEYVLFDHIGAGCVCNFVQHRYIDSPEPVFRFYFDGETLPRFSIRPSQFGEKYPFVSPLADKFIGPKPADGHAIRVVRSFVPMPFARSCMITSSLKLEDNCVPGGGWGHVVYHMYDEAADTVPFDPDDPGYRRLAALWSNAGANPLRADRAVTATQTGFTLAPGETRALFEREGAGLICGVHLALRDYTPAMLRQVRVTARWEDEAAPGLDTPLGCFCLNELGVHATRCLMAGMDAEGGFYNRYPMPFSRHAVLAVTNDGDTPVTFDLAAVSCTDEYNAYFAATPYGHFRSGAYRAPRCTHAADAIIADIAGNGHIVASVITATPTEPGRRADCEGDARIHFDGIRTPQIESDGSESYSCYGWGFCSPPQTNPVSGYDGSLPDVHADWSMARTLPGDWYPFAAGCRFGIESAWRNDYDMIHSGTVFWYGEPDVRLVPLGRLDIGDATSEAAFGFVPLDGAKPVLLTSRFEGDDDDLDVTLCGRYPARGSEFTVRLPDVPCALLLRRVSDQRRGRQYARVSVDGVPLGRPWYYADANVFCRWLEDDYTVPAAALGGKSAVRVRVEPLPAPGADESTFNEFGYACFAVLE